MNELLILRSAAQFLKKLDRLLKMKVLQVLEEIAQNPLLGQKLTGDLKTVYSYHFRDNGVEYRLAYLFHEEDERIIVIFVGTRENFYAELRKRMTSV